MESSASRNAVLGLKIAGLVILAIIAWKLLVALTGILWFVIKVAVVLAIAGGALMLVTRAVTGTSLPGGRRSLP